MHIAKVWVSVRHCWQDRSDMAVLLNFCHAFQMPLSTGPSSVDPSLLFPPTSFPSSTPVPPSIFYSQSTQNHPDTPQSVHPNQYSHIEQDIWQSQLRLWDTWQRFCQLQSRTGDQWLSLGTMPCQQFLNRFLLTSQDKPVFECKEVEMYTWLVSSGLCFCANYALPTFDR